MPPQFLDEESSQSHVSVQESHDVRLVCRARGVPKPVIRWTREDGLLFTASRSGQGKVYVTHLTTLLGLFILVGEFQKHNMFNVILKQKVKRLSMVKHKHICVTVK